MTEFLEHPWGASVQRLYETRQQLLAELSPTSSGIAWCAEHTQIIDAVVSILSEDVRRTFPEAPRLAIIATGGYGRCELAPYSDVDLTVVPEEEDSPYLDQALRTLFRSLHQSLGSIFELEIGYAYRLIADVPGLDSKTRTGLLDARLVSGSQSVFSSLMESCWQSLPSGEFILSKITEREEAMRKTHDTPLVIEPHLKEGSGGLRSFQAANWIRAAIGERPLRQSQSYDTLLSVRNLLHQVSGRRQDLLSRRRQSEIDERTGWPSQAMMERVSASLLEGQEVFSTTVERLQEARFSLSEAVMALRGEARVISPADPADAAVGIAIATKLSISVSPLPASFAEHVSGEKALFALGAGEETLRNLDRCGVLNVLLPELTACRTLLPDDNTHTYSVFEHTVRVIRHLAKVENEPYLRDLRDSISDLEPLYLAALLHDVGKLETFRNGVDHSVQGEIIARQVGKRWGLAPDTVETVAWLVREHLTLALTMRMRDLLDPMTIMEFAQIVKEPGRLKMLALLTWADISSVAEGAFTSSQSIFLRELVTKTLDLLEGDVHVNTEPNLMRIRLQRELSQKDISELEIDSFLASLPASYLASTAPELVPLHMSYVAKAKQGQLSLESHQRLDLSATEITVCAPDTPGLLSQVLGAIYAYDLSTSAIRASTTDSEMPIAIDVFTVTFGGRPVPAGTWGQLSAALRELLTGQLGIEDLMRKRSKVPERRQEIYSFRLLDGPPAILEIEAPRGRGVAFRLSRLLSEEGLEIQSARVGQWAGAAAAAFYIKVDPNAPNLRERIERVLAPHLRSRH